MKKRYLRLAALTAGVTGRTDRMFDAAYYAYPDVAPYAAMTRHCVIIRSRH